MSRSRTLLGVLTPSSNTALEPLTSAMLADVDNVSAHFSRFRVTRISLEARDLGQFDDTPILAAAELLADAKVDAIGWSGTSAGWMGFEQDVALCRRITEATGIPATSSILALNEILERTRTKTLGLVSPYLADVQGRIISHYRDQGVECVAENHLDIDDNFQFSEVDSATLDHQVAAVASASPEAITLYCTNLRSAQMAARWESQHGIPVFDTTTTVIWKLLRMTGHDTKGITGWGRLFQEID
jgi:maleate isomerase|tara:strand:- start:296 stop:1027 length:732 start_codon:yes stop_codon:yes gene_type:complete